jgi:DNA-binding response OmpR family regulator
MNENILLVEDEEALRMTLGDRLKSTGYVVDFAADGEEGFEKSTHLPYDLIILDVMLPHRSGLDLCQEVRKSGLATPILLLTARGQTIDKVVGLNLGADDYVTKPFDTLELLARIEALLRRAPNRPALGTEGVARPYRFGDVCVDIRGTQVTREGQPVYLTLREFELLRYFIQHQGTTLSRGDLLREVWGYEAGTFTRTVDVHVASLRQKLEKSPKNPEMIITVAGLGYRFNG